MGDWKVVALGPPPELERIPKAVWVEFNTPYSGYWTLIVPFTGQITDNGIRKDVLRRLASFGAREAMLRHYVTQTLIDKPVEQCVYEDAAVPVQALRSKRLQILRT